MSDGGLFPILDPVTQQFVDSLPVGPTREPYRPAEATADLRRMQALPIGKPRVAIEDVVLPVGPTGLVRARMIRPPNLTGPLPVVMLFHGGVSMLGDMDTHDRLMREIAVGAGAAVVFVGYGRPPESRFPVAIEQAYAATKYVIDQAHAFNLDGTRLALLGDSAGGNVAIAVALLARKRRGPRVALQVLLHPVTGADFTTASYQRFADGPWLTRSAMMWFWDAYEPDRERRRDSRVAPINASIDDLRNLPDALVIVAEGDVLCDEGEAYARKLADAGVRVTSIRYNGTIHDFMLLHALADTPAVRSALAQTVFALRDAFE